MSFAARRTDAAVPDDERLELIMPDSNAVAMYSDVRCPWAHVAVHRLLRAVELAGLGGEVAIDHRAAPLERSGEDDTGELVAAARVLADAEPEAGWYRFDDAGDFPRSSSRALAHVQAAKATSPLASVDLDRQLRHKLWNEGRDIDDASVIAEAVAQVPDLDPQRLADELDSGRPDAEIQAQADTTAEGLVPGSPTVVLPDGTAWSNPGIEVGRGDGGPVLEHDDPSVYDEILDRFLALRTYD